MASSSASAADFPADEQGYASDGGESSSSGTPSISSSSLSLSSDQSSHGGPVLDEQFLPRILSLFFAIFHPTEGPKVLYQVPEGSVTKTEDPPTDVKGKAKATLRTAMHQERLFEFETLSDYLIPKAPLCGRLITCTTRASSTGSASPNDHRDRHRSPSRSRSRSRVRSPQRNRPTNQQKQYKILSYPVLIQDSAKYQRNTFIFNLAFVFDGKADVKSYEPVVRKCARTLKGLEESLSFLSSPHSQPRMYGVVEQLFQDLNSYCEAFLSLPEAPHTSYLKPARQQQIQNNANIEAAMAQARLKDPTSLAALSSSVAATASASLSRSLLANKAAALDDPHAHPRRGSIPDDGSSVKSLPAASPALDPAGLTSGMSPIEETSGIQKAIAASSQKRPSISASLSEATLSMGAISQGVTKPPLPGSRRGSISPAGSLIMSGGVAPMLSETQGSGGASTTRRPTISRAKTVSTAAVNEAKVSVASRLDATSPTATTTTSQSSSDMRRVLSNSSASSSSSHPSASLTMRKSLSSQNAPQPADSREESIQAIAADLSSSLMSLRTVDNTVNSTDDQLFSVLPPPPPSVPGQREAPHGLGRTVREAINVKLFPTYANPPPVRDWDVPVSLLDLGQREASMSLGDRSVGSNWDLTMAAIYPYVDGINHVKRISQLADADLELTRQCMEHLLYYGCILMVDIFQFVNIYTLKPAIARLADEPSIQAECGPYVTRPGYEIPAWPVLLDLYTALRPGVRLDTWMEERKIEGMGIDARRFVTFGIIKGFLRRMHRYPVLLSPMAKDSEDGEAEEVRIANRLVQEARIGGDQRRASPRRSSPRLQPKRSLTMTVQDAPNLAFATGQRTRRELRDEEEKEADSWRNKDASQPWPAELPSLLDGSRCEDELCVRFGMRWSQMRKVLIELGSAVQDSSSGSRSRSREAPTKKGNHQTQSEEWPLEPAPFANASGFGGMGGQSGFSGWQSGISTASTVRRYAPRRVSSSGNNSSSQQKTPVGHSSSNPSPALSAAPIPSRVAAAKADAEYSEDYEMALMEEEEEEEKKAEEMEKRGGFGAVALLLL